MGRCVAVGCQEIGSHKFPSDPTLRRKWERALRRGNFKVSDYSRLCTKHFKDTDFETISKGTGFPLQRKFLKKSAIPTIFSWNTMSGPGSSSRAERLQRRNVKRCLIPRTVTSTTIDEPLLDNTTVTEVSTGIDYAHEVKISHIGDEGSKDNIPSARSSKNVHQSIQKSNFYRILVLDDSLIDNQLDLDRQRRDENDLKREITMKNAAIEELKIELKNKSATLQADLAQANAEKASLEEELASARLALERQQRQARQDTNRLNSEIHSLRQRLDRADADLVHSRRENLRLSEQISTLEKELNMKNLTPMPSENKKDKELSSMFESMENKHAKTVAELESMIQSQNSLMEKLTGECRSLTDKLDDANRRHKLEKSQLLCRNSELMRKLRNLWSSHKKYCTTTVAPFRSYTPLSGYPSSLYDLDRTYSTSTPYTYRYRRDRSKITNNIDDLNGNLSDLSIDRIDSDDDASKVRTAVDDLAVVAYCMEELATLQRQIRDLGQSLPKPSHPPSTYQARTSHLPTADGTPAAQTSTRPRDPRAEPTRHSPLGENGFRDNVNRHNEAEPVENPQSADIKHYPDDNQYHTEIAQDYQNPHDNSQYHTEIAQDYHNPDDNSQYHTESAQDYQNSGDNNQYRTETEQDYQNSVDNNQTEPVQGYHNSDDNSQHHTETVQDYQNSDSTIQHAAEKYQNDTDKLESKVDNSGLEQLTNARQQEVSKDNQTKNDNGVHKQGNSEFVENKNAEPTEYREYQESKDLHNTDPNQPTEQYDEQSYNQNYEQPQYSEQYENYEQYQQEYADPNAQYDNQYENYQTDGNYVEQNPDNIQYNQDINPETVVNEQNYDNTQYNQEYNEFETTQNVNESSTPKDNLISES